MSDIGNGLWDLVLGTGTSKSGQSLYYALGGCSFCSGDLYLNYKANRGYCVPKCLGCSRVFNWAHIEELITKDQLTVKVREPANAK